MGVRRQPWGFSWETQPDPDPVVSAPELQRRRLTALLGREHEHLTYVTIRREIDTLSDDDVKMGLENPKSLNITLKKHGGASPAERRFRIALLQKLQEYPPVPRGQSQHPRWDDRLPDINPKTGLTYLGFWEWYGADIEGNMKSTLGKGVNSKIRIWLPWKIVPWSRIRLPFPHLESQLVMLQHENRDLTWSQIQAGWWSVYRWQPETEETEEKEKPVKKVPPKERRPARVTWLVMKTRAVVLGPRATCDIRTLDQTLTRASLPLPLQEIRYRGISINNQMYVHMARTLNHQSEGCAQWMRERLIRFIAANKGQVAEMGVDYLAYTDTTMEDIMEGLREGEDVNELIMQVFALMTGRPVVYVTHLAQMMSGTHWNVDWVRNNPLMTARVGEEDAPDTWWVPLGPNMELIRDMAKWVKPDDEEELQYRTLKEDLPNLGKYPLTKVPWKDYRRVYTQTKLAGVPLGVRNVTLQEAEEEDNDTSMSDLDKSFGEAVSWKVREDIEYESEVGEPSEAEEALNKSFEAISVLRKRDKMPVWKVKKDMDDVPEETEVVPEAAIEIEIESAETGEILIISTETPAHQPTEIPGVLKEEEIEQGTEEKEKEERTIQERGEGQTEYESPTRPGPSVERGARQAPTRVQTKSALYHGLEGLSEEEQMRRVIKMSRRELEEQIVAEVTRRVEEKQRKQAPIRSTEEIKEDERRERGEKVKESKGKGKGKGKGKARREETSSATQQPQMTWRTQAGREATQEQVPSPRRAETPPPSVAKPGPSSPAIQQLRPRAEVPAPEWTVKMERALPTIPDVLKNKVIWIEDDGRSRVEEFEPQRQIRIKAKKQVAKKSTVGFSRRTARQQITSDTEPEEEKDDNREDTRKTPVSREEETEDDDTIIPQTSDDEDEINSEPEYDPNYRRFRCLRDGCKAEFPEEFALKKHYVYVHEENELRCGLCANRYGTAERLLRHQRKHLQRYYCPYCEEKKRYGGWEKYTVKLHIRKHRGDRPYPCKSCNARFKEKKDLKNHQPGCDPDVPLLTCPRCPKSFYNRLSWRRHVGHFHDLHYECEEPGCYEMFNNTSARTRHREIHATGPQGGEQGDKTKKWKADQTSGSQTETRLQKRKKAREIRQLQREEHVRLERESSGTDEEKEETPPPIAPRRRPRKPAQTFKREAREVRELEGIRDEDLIKLLGVLQGDNNTSETVEAEREDAPGQGEIENKKEKESTDVEVIGMQLEKETPVKDEAEGSSTEPEDILPDSSSEASLEPHECTNEEDLLPASPSDPTN